MKTAVVILNFNGRKHLEQYLPSVLEHSADAAVIVADNGSTDDSVAYLQAEFPEVELIIMPDNQGFAGGYNAALEQVNAEYLVLLNSDVEVTANWIAPIISLMDADTSVAACAPKLLDWTNRNAFEYAGGAGGYIDTLGYPFCRGRLFLHMEEDEQQYNDTREVFWATGACCFVRASCFREAGGFDAYYFAHMEEIDLCWRFKRMGYKVLYCAESTVYHLGGGTLAAKNPRKTFLNFRNNLITLYKNHPQQGFALALFTKLVLDGVAGAKFLAEGGFSHFVAVLKAHFAFYGKLGMHRKQRRALSKQMSNEPLSQVYQRGIVWQVFAKAKRSFSALDEGDFS